MIRGDTAVDEQSGGLRVFATKPSSSGGPGAVVWIAIAGVAVLGIGAAGTYALLTRAPEKPPALSADAPAVAAKTFEAASKQQNDGEILRAQLAQAQREAAALRSQIGNPGGNTRRGAAPVGVANGGFEEADGSKPLFWIPETYGSPPAFPDANASPFAIDREIKRGGAQALRFSTAKDHFVHLRHRQLVPVEPRHKYVLKAWVKTKDVVAQHRKADGGAHIRVKTGGQAVKFSEPLYDTVEWQALSVEFEVEDANAVEVYVELGYYGNLASGTVWFDDVVLEPQGGGKDDEGKF
jgi:hypothetical protein